MKLISKEFFRNEEDKLIIDELVATVELDNKQYKIILDNQSNYSQKKYSFGTSEYSNDDVNQDIIEQFENSDFYYELCKFAKSEAISRDNDNEEEIEKILEQNYYIYKKDKCYYNNIRMIIYKNKEEEEFVLKVKDIKDHTESYYKISQSDFENDIQEVDLKEYYEFDSRNQINDASDIS